MDDYSPLRTGQADLQEREATLFDVKDSWLYLQGYQYGGERKGSNGDAFFSADNPAYGAVFSYYLRDGYQSMQQRRREQEKAIEKEGDTPYPSWDTLRKETERRAHCILEVDANGDVVRRIDAVAKKGFHRVAWDMHYPSSAPVKLSKPSGYVPPWAVPPKGPMALPGQYTVTLKKRQFGEVSVLSEAQSFNLNLLNNSPEITTDRVALLDTQKRVANLFRSVRGASRAQAQIKDRINHLTAAIDLTPASTEQCPGGTCADGPCCAIECALRWRCHGSCSSRACALVGLWSHIQFVLCDHWQSKSGVRQSSRLSGHC